MTATEHLGVWEDADSRTPEPFYVFGLFSRRNDRQEPNPM
jgi:hypothetical protein